MRWLWLLIAIGVGVLPSVAQEATVEEMRLSHSEPISDADWSPDGSRVVVVADKIAYVWDTITGEQLLSVPSDLYYRPQFSPDGQQIAVYQDQAVKIIAIDSQQIVATLAHEQLPQNSLWNSTGSYLAVQTRSDRTPTAQYQVTIWNLTTQTQIATTPVKDDFIRWSWSPSGTYLTLISLGYELQVLRVGETEVTQVIQADRYFGERLQWSADETTVLLDGIDHKVLIFNTITGEVAQEILADNIFRAFWSPDETRIAGTLARSSQMPVWDAQTGKQWLVLDHGDLHADQAFWSPDGTQILTTAYLREQGRYRLSVWNSADGTLLSELAGVDHELSYLFISPNARWVISWSNRGSAIDPYTTQIWQIETWERVLTININSFASGQRPLWDPAGQRLLIKNGFEIIILQFE